ncbi:MAG: acetate kinase [Candidatus Omnitrophota bacterium]|nr:acetate kinase [Candidatus Omnitrophota bacterium]
MKVLVLNSGSSSIKYQLFDMPSQKLLFKGMIEQIGEKASKIKNHEQGIILILKKIQNIQAVGHRVVQGGERFQKPCLINKQVIKRIGSYCKIAPLHNPANLSGILACLKFMKGIPQVAVFDTAFHQTIPDFAYLYGLPYKFYNNLGIRKYGFHGTSHEYVTKEAAKILNKPLNKVSLITCHLGNGCSITAVENGKSVDTSMGFTPLEGLLMGTRCGDLDPAIVTYLQRRMNFSPERIDQLLNKESGLLGISGISNDMRRIRKAAKNGNSRARLAIKIFIYRIRKYIGAYLTILGKIDALVFTAGIGENQSQIRKNICFQLFDNLKKKPKVLVITTNEELMIAKQTFSLLSQMKTRLTER